MKALLLCNNGVEDLALWELSTYLKINSCERLSGGVAFECASFEQLFELCYRSQSANKILSLVGSFDCVKLKQDDILKGIQGMDFSQWLNSERTLAVRSDIEPINSTSREIEAEAGAIIIEKTSCKVNLSKPQVLVYVTRLENRCFVGVDIAGEDLSKREYRIFSGREAIKAALGAYAFWKSQASKGQTVLDPFCRDGTMTIEGAHLAIHRAVRFHSKEKFLFRRMPAFLGIDFDKFFATIDKQALGEAPYTIIALDEQFQHVSSAKKNAKIAGVEKMLKFSRREAEWLDIKFKEGEVDHIVTFVPQASRSISLIMLDKIIKEFFFQAAYILSKRGTLTLLTKDPAALEAAAAYFKFNKAYTQTIAQGAETYFVVGYARV